MFEFEGNNVNNNPLLAYLQSQSPETIAEIAQAVSPEVKQIVAQNIQNLVGMLPSRHFNVEITTNRENLAGLLGSAMMTGYFLRQMESRMELDRSLDAVSSLEEAE